jgi:hypothetical protein
MRGMELKPGLRLRSVVDAWSFFAPKGGEGALSVGEVLLSVQGAKPLPSPD